jgi:hypothetical protein
MYTLEELQQKSIKELKEIGWQLNVLPAGDRRCRQSWIDALASAKLPLLQLLETSKGVEVDPVSLADRTGGRKFPRCRSRSRSRRN